MTRAKPKPMRPQDLTLTGNEFALCMDGVMLAVNWWKRQGRSAYARGRRHDCEVLNRKLWAIFNRAYPSDLDADYAGDDILLRVTPPPKPKRSGREERQ